MRLPALGCAYWSWWTCTGWEQQSTQGRLATYLDGVGSLVRGNLGKAVMLFRDTEVAILRTGLRQAVTLKFIQYLEIVAPGLGDENGVFLTLRSWGRALHCVLLVSSFSIFGYSVRRES